MGINPGVSTTTNLSKNSVPTPPFSQSGLTPGFTYYFIVTAVNDSGESSASFEVSAVAP
jgi:hypothetical protein